MKTKNVKMLLLICGLGLFLAACQKEVDFQDLDDQGGGNNGGVNGELVDDWNFIGLNAKTNTSVTVSEAGQQVKAVAFSDYVSENNVGTLKVTINQFIFAGIGHTINDEVNIKLYLNGFLVDNSDSAFNYTTPPSDNTIDYVRNSNDSITFTNAIMTLPDPAGGGSAPAGPMGARISISGDTLYVTVKNSLDTTISQGGSPANLSAQYESTMRFTRQ
jgi:hypothetical protein